MAENILNANQRDRIKSILLVMTAKTSFSEEELEEAIDEIANTFTGVPAQRVIDPDGYVYFVDADEDVEMAFGPEATVNQGFFIFK